MSIYVREPPAAPPAIPTWQDLVTANPSLRSWELSAQQAGIENLTWWPRWADNSVPLRNDIIHALPADSTSGEFRRAKVVVLDRLAIAFERGARKALAARGRTGR
jgi:hypothetical protein